MKRAVPLWVQAFGVVWLGWGLIVLAHYLDVRFVDLFVGLSLIKG